MSNSLMKNNPKKRNAVRHGAFTVAMLTLLMNGPFSAAEEKPNILIIWGDDVGMWNLSAYHRGMMGGSTPNIDRIAKDGMIFMDHYAKASCTAGRHPGPSRQSDREVCRNI